MKNFFTLILIFSVFGLFAQSEANFDSFLDDADTYWNGADLSGGFQEVNAFFPNYFQVDTVWGNYWASGWAISNSRNDTLGSYTDLTSAITASGHNSNSYAVGQQNAIIQLTGNSTGTVVGGFYATNTTYAFYGMSNGDFFAKKFGGIDGTDPDFFRLKIQAYYNGALKPDSVMFYLADYRSTDPSEDYILDEWQWVDLTSLGNCDSLICSMESSDFDDNGYLTPLFFAIDNFTTTDVADIDSYIIFNDEINTYPNPITDYINVDIRDIANNLLNISVLDLWGNSVASFNDLPDSASINLHFLPSGIYFLRFKTEKGISTKKIEKI